MLPWDLSCLSIRLPALLVSNRLPLDGFPWHPILQQFMKICRENGNLVRIEQKHRALEHPSAFCCRRRHYIVMQALCSSEMVSDSWIADSYKHYANVQQHCLIRTSPVFVLQTFHLTSRRVKVFKLSPVFRFVGLKWISTRFKNVK